MDKIRSTLNYLLVDLFNDILKIEEQSIAKGEFSDLTVTEMHIIEVIGLYDNKNMSSVAKNLDITIGTLTVAVNNLVRKEYVERVKSEKDKRVVLISLTEKGKDAFMKHEAFHREMIEATVGKLTNEELELLIASLDNLNHYFQQKYHG